MVILDPSRRSYHRIEIAAQLAVRHKATLVGMFACHRPEPAWVYRLPDGAGYLDALQARYEEDVEVMRRSFEGATEALPITAQWRAFDGLPWPSASAKRAWQTCWWSGQADPADPMAFVAEGFVESIVLASGRPVLAIPRVGRFKTVGGRVLIAWDGGREAARAIHDALPFLRQAEAVTIAHLHGGGQGRRPLEHACAVRRDLAGGAWRDGGGMQPPRDRPCRRGRTAAVGSRRSGSRSHRGRRLWAQQVPRGDAGWRDPDVAGNP
ncbi:hypothetical protein ACU4GD_39305 [Cupriavidus basilensis]